MAREKNEPTTKAMVGAMIDCVMDAPVDPDHGFPPERVASLREQIAEIHARGSMVDLPWDIDKFRIEDWLD